MIDLNQALGSGFPENYAGAMVLQSGMLRAIVLVR
jgi:hypothetical protein